MSQSIRLLWTYLALQKELNSSVLWKLWQVLKKSGKRQEHSGQLKELFLQLDLGSKQKTIIASYDPKQTIRQLNWLKQENIELIFHFDNLFPRHLLEVGQPPFMLFVKGKKHEQVAQVFSEIASKPCVAVVGSRKINNYGRFVTQKIVRELVDFDISIISGFMYGVDQIAHQTALEEEGKTIGVLGFGLSSVPAGTLLKLTHSLNKGMLFISEFAPSQPPTKWTFVQRNRLVSGLSQVVVITQAAKKSGSHITAQFGLDQGKVVCAIPGPINDPYCEGTAWLVQQGASLVTSGQDIIRESELFSQLQKTIVSNQVKMPESISQKHFQKDLAYPKSDSCGTLETLICDHLHGQNLTTDQLAQQCNVPVTQACVALSNLELQGLISRQANKWMLEYTALKKGTKD